VDPPGRVLLQRRRDNGVWEPPGGVLELDERVADGVIREVREETGIHVELVTLTGVYKSMTHAVIELVFLCRATGGNLAVSAESTEFTWADRDLIATLTTEAFTARILDALAYAGRPAIREHDGFRLV
jgi:ADP-ribose pyrophosphatase YjhB (NUDIX family)